MISKRPHLFTSESVTEGHPDKMADQVSDAILDEFLIRDPKAHVAIECLLKTGLCFIAGEVRTDAQLNLATVARKTIKDIGYDDDDKGFNADTCSVLIAVEEQSKDIAIGVDASAEKEQGAGDQGMMFGFACDETDQYMPLPISYAHALSRRLAEVRKNKTLPFLGPDGKTQVTVLYEDQRPKGVTDIVLSTQHLPHIDQKTIREAVIEEIIKKTISAEHLLPNVNILTNPTGAFVIGGPKGDTGLTGRKIIVDTYGGMGRHGGGAFSGKDPSKVDRSAAYAARYIAKNIVAAGLAKRCEVQIAYAIGISAPVSLMVNTFGTNAVDEQEIEISIKKIAPLKPKDIIDRLDLLRPIYLDTARNGHFGHSTAEHSWEKLDLVPKLRDLL